MHRQLNFAHAHAHCDVTSLAALLLTIQHQWHFPTCPSCLEATLLVFFPAWDAALHSAITVRLDKAGVASPGCTGSWTSLTPMLIVKSPAWPLCTTMQSWPHGSVAKRCCSPFTDLVSVLHAHQQRFLHQRDFSTTELWHRQGWKRRKLCHWSHNEFHTWC